MSECSDKMPVEIRNAIKKLNTDLNWEIYMMVCFEGKLYYDQIRDRLNIDSSKMHKSLNALADGGLISERIEKLSDITNHKKKFYTSTTLGRDLLNKFYETIPTAKKE